MLLNSKIVNQGWKLNSFSLMSTSEDLINDKELLKKNGLAVAFICNHCPYVKDIINRIVIDFTELQQKEVGTVAIMPNDSTAYPEDSYENMQKFAKDFKFNFHYLYDENQEVAKKYSAVCTPDFFCFDGESKLFYRGRLDDLKYKSKNIKMRNRELIKAFDLKINKNKIYADQIPSMGCSIKWKKTS